MGVEYQLLLSKGFLPEGRGDVVPFVVRVRGAKASGSPSLYLVAIDSSWSMDGSKMFFAKEAVLQMLRELDPEDLVSVYSFCGRVRRVVSNAKVGDAEMVARAVADIRLGGGTDIHKVLEQMYMDASLPHASGLGRKPLDTKVVLVTDGNPTTGVRDGERILEMAERLGRHVSVSLVIGVGRDYNERLLAGIAGKTKGFFEHLDDPAKMPSLVKKMVSAYRRVSAKNVRLFIRTPPGVGVYVYNRPAYSVRGGTEVEVGDVYEGELVKLAGEFVVPPQRRGLAYIAFVSASHEIDGKVSEAEVASVSLPCVSKVPPDEVEVDEKVFREVNMVRTAMVLANDIYGSISASTLNRLIEDLTNATISVDAGDLYSRTIDLRAQLEGEGVSPEVVKKVVSLVSRILSGRYLQG